MTSSSDIARRVARLENDRDALYELIGEIRSTQHEHTHRFDELDSTLTEVLRRLGT
jgi:hypothetical protein